MLSLMSQFLLLGSFIVKMFWLFKFLAKMEKTVNFAKNTFPPSSTSLLCTICPSMQLRSLDQITYISGHSLLSLWFIYPTQVRFVCIVPS